MSTQLREMGFTETELQWQAYCEHWFKGFIVETMPSEEIDKKMKIF